MSRRAFTLAAVAAVALAGCEARITGPRDTGLDLLALSKVQPALVLPGTRIAALGRSFVDDTLGATRLHLRGTLDGQQADLTLAATYVSGSELAITAPSDAPIEGAFDGLATVEVDSTVDMKTHASADLPLKLTFARTVTPTLAAVGDGLSFVNQPVEVDGDNFLFGGDEGVTVAVLTGCFTPQGATACGASTTVTVEASPLAAYDRTRIVFPYATSISGIGPGTFTGQLTLRNRFPDGSETRSSPKSVRFDIQPPTILGASTTAASLGQYVIIRGGGFVGAPPGTATDEVTLLELTATFTPDAGGPGMARALNVSLVPEWRSGPEVRYVVDESDPIGQLVDLRHESGTIQGTIQPVVEKGKVRVDGAVTPVALRILPVRQVLYVNFLPSFVQSLRRFGLRAADPLLRQRVFSIVARDYQGVNLVPRDAVPDDFALYSQVDIAGPDPNGLGLLGYDNSPGKDTDNVRLYDRIGGVNATTQQDGYPGFGGIFAESFFGFSQHPNGLATPLGEPEPSFDQVFDPFRPDQGGQELTATELAELSPPMLTDGSSCPAPKGDRRGQVACAIFVLGNLIGTTLTHEVGHSLGLANPYGDGFHDFGDGLNRLMDAGGDRPFAERAELDGQGPAVFCDTEYDYLRTILPSSDPPPAVTRPTCD